VASANQREEESEVIKYAVCVRYLLLLLDIAIQQDRRSPYGIISSGKLAAKANSSSLKRKIEINGHEKHQARRGIVCDLVMLTRMWQRKIAQRSGKI